MADVAYILITLAFYGLMVAYVRGCERLGHEAGRDEDRP
jgi:hypothetical protein